MKPIKNNLMIPKQTISLLAVMLGLAAPRVPANPIDIRSDVRSARNTAPLVHFAGKPSDSTGGSRNRPTPTTKGEWYEMTRPNPVENPAENPAETDDKRIIAALDTEYQAAVRNNDAATMGRILADDFVLVTGKGKTFTKADLLKEASEQKVIYEHQEDSNQTVRVWGNTAVITALLWAKGSDHGKPFEYRLWFSDTYVRTSAGWRYVFGQSSIPLPEAAQ